MNDSNIEKNFVHIEQIIFCAHCQQDKETLHNLKIRVKEILNKIEKYCQGKEIIKPKKFPPDCIYSSTNNNCIYSSTNNNGNTARDAIIHPNTVTTANTRKERKVKSDDYIVLSQPLNTIIEKTQSVKGKKKTSQIKFNPKNNSNGTNK